MASSGPAVPGGSEGPTTDPMGKANGTSAPSTATETTLKCTNGGGALAVGVSTFPDSDNFQGSVGRNDELPSAATLKAIEDYIVLDSHGKSHAFKTLYTGKQVARRVMVIFVRHFFCGQCQEYLRTLSASITPDSLLGLPISTFIAVVGCGDAKLIDMYAAATGCPFPIYADPTRKLYDGLGMMQTLRLGPRPAYAKKSLLKSSLDSVVQCLKQMKAGLTGKGGEWRQIGGEFLFEPADAHSPLPSPRAEDVDKPVDAHAEERAEAKTVTWCHRMRNTRDHAEMPELMEVLGLDGHGQPVDDQKRWARALQARKGTGLSMANQIGAIKEREKRSQVANAAEKSHCPAQVAPEASSGASAPLTTSL